MVVSIWGRVGRMYERSLLRRPFLTEMSTSGLIWCGGDLAAQYLDHDGPSSSLKVDWWRTVIQTVYASLIWAPFAHKWYKVLDRIAVSVAGSASGTNFVATKLVMEIVALHPISLFAFFNCVGRMSGDSHEEIMEQIRRDFIPTLMLEIALWTPLDAANFAFIPVKHQLLAVNCGCFLESIGLSFVKKNGIEL